MEGKALKSDINSDEKFIQDIKPFECDVCDRRFIYAGNMKTHKRIHTGETPHKCDVCCKGFTQAGSLNIHNRIHSREKPFRCDVCDKRFTCSGNMKVHKRVHTGERLFKCDVCDKTFTQSGSVKIHHRSIHANLFKTESTSHTNLVKSKSKDHTKLIKTGKVRQIVHAEEKPFECDICQKRYKILKSMKDHRRRKHGKENQLLKCNYCDRVFGSSSQHEFLRHQLEHELKATEPSGIGYVCFHCDVSFDLASELIEHAGSCVDKAKQEPESH